MPESLPGVDTCLLHDALADDWGGTERHEHDDDDLKVAPCGYRGDLWDGVAPLCDDGYTVVYTDGACIHNQDARFRKAGVGVFRCIADSLNISMALPGWGQTNQRAELYA
eukprot:8482666-Karenia_brevis.AAC.1